MRTRSTSIPKLPLHTFIRNEEERSAWRRSDDCAANAIVDAAEAARGPEAGAGLEAGFEGVEGEERGVYCCAC